MGHGQSLAQGGGPVAEYFTDSDVGTHPVEGIILEILVIVLMKS